MGRRTWGTFFDSCVVIHLRLNASLVEQSIGIRYANVQRKMWCYVEDWQARGWFVYLSVDSGGSEEITAARGRA